MGFFGNLFNQINPFDNGKTFSNPVGNNPAPKPVTTPPPQASQNAPVSTSKPANQHPNFFQKVGAQLNPFDNGRTWSNPNPTNTRSVVGQLTHNGVTDVAGNFLVKPFVINPAQNVIETGRAIAAEATNNAAATNASVAREKTNLTNSLPGQIANMATHTVSGAIIDPLKGTIAQATHNPVAEANANNASVKDFNKTPFGQVFSPLQHVLAGNQVRRDLPNLTKDQQAQAIKTNLIRAGMDPNKTLGGQLTDSAVSAATLAAIPLGMKAGEAPAAASTDAVAATEHNTAIDPQTGKTVITSPVSGRQVKLPGELGTPPGGAPKPSVIESPSKYVKGPAGTNALEGRIPVKAVNEGDYAHARVAPQLASNPIDVATGQAAYAASKLGKADKAALIDAVENPQNHPNMSPGLTEAVRRVNYLTDRVNATSNGLAVDEFGKTPYVNNYFHHNVDLSNPADAARYAQLAKETNNVTAENFHGINNIPRVFKDVNELHANGFHLVGEKLGKDGQWSHPNPAQAIVDYGRSASNGVSRQALIKAAGEADRGNAVANGAPRTLDVGGGKSITLSDQGMKEFKGYKPSGDPGKVLSGYRALNKGFKQTLLSVSQFHPININALQAAPSLLLRGHPLLAAQGLGDTVASLVSKGYSDKLIQGALENGTIDKAAMMGTPIKFGSDFRASGVLGDAKQGKTSGFGEKAIFERQLPAMHIKMVDALSKDLAKRNIALDSPKALEAGTTVNKIMGYINTAVQNHDPAVQKALGDILLAPQFTRAKWEVLGDALSKGPTNVAGNYARSAVIGKYLTEAGIVQGVGAATGQTQNNIVDNLKQTLVGPRIPTPWKDSKGNTITLKLPQNYASEALNLGVNANRGNDGRLHLNVNPSAIPGNVENYGRSRLAVIPSNVLKVATNTDYAGKPMYDPTKPLGTKVQQAATTVVANTLPIGLQGVAQTNAVTSHLPQNMQDVLKAERPGSNPVLKSALSALGATPSTDTSTGKGLQTKQYYDALAASQKGLNANDKAAFNSIHQQTKDPVTGNYIIQPTVFDSAVKSNLYQAHPAVLAADTKLNQTLQSQGQKIDPFFNLSPDQQKAYLAYETMQPLSADRTDWLNKNPWYNNFANQQQTFFNGLPAADPNRPTAPIKYPSTSGDLTNKMNTYYGIPKDNTVGKTNFLNSNPDVVAQLNAQFQYDNAIRVARGYAAVKDSPQPTAQLQKYMDTYNAADKATRANIRNSNPQQYQSMIAFYDSTDLSGIAKQAAVSNLQGEPDTTSAELKKISSLASDIYKNAAGTYNIVPAGWMQGLSNNFGGSSGQSSGFKTSNGAYFKAANPTFSKNDTSLAKLSKQSTNPFKLPKAFTPRVGTSSMRIAKAPKPSLGKLSLRSPQLKLPKGFVSSGKSQRVILS